MSEPQPELDAALPSAGAAVSGEADASSGRPSPWTDWRTLAWFAAAAAGIVTLIATRSFHMPQAALSAAPTAESAASGPPISVRGYSVVMGYTLLFAGLIVWLFQQVSGVIASALLNLPQDADPTLGQLARAHTITYVGTLLGMGASFMFMPALYGFLGLGLRARSTQAALFAAACVIPIVMSLGIVSGEVARLIAERSGAAPPPQVAHSTLRLLEAGPGGDSAGWWALVLAVVVGAPLVEEIIYRGLLQNGLELVLGRTAPAIAITSAIFALVHLPVAEPFAIPVLFALSLAFGTLYARTRSLPAAVLMHALFNGFNVALAVMLHQPPSV